jgi:phosphate transport system substrate-binding protein
MPIRMWTKTALVALAVAWMMTSSNVMMAHAQVAVDPDLPTYERVGGVSGNLNSIGSDTLNNLMTLWAEGFRAIYPNVNIQIEGKGSSTAPPALIEGTAQLGPMSRPMKAKELDTFEKKYGYKPTPIKVAIDALAVFAHKDNPIAGLTLTQVDSIFSSTYKRGGKPIRTWGDVGLQGAWANRPISLYGRNSASGTYGMFKKIVLKKGDYKDTVKEQPGSSSVVQGVASDLGGIGYSGIGYKTSGVKAVALGDRHALYEPTLEHALAGDYPLARFLYIYVNKKPNESLDKLIVEFMTFVLSKHGQEIVVKDGYYPLPASVATETVGTLKRMAAMR